MFIKSKIAMAVGFVVSTQMVFAQETDTSNVESNAGLEEVVVTAQKREQNLQDVPVAVTAYNAQAINDQAIRNISDVSATTPNVEIVPSPASTNSATIAIRGATMVNPAITWEPAAGLYFDGVYVAKNQGGLFDVADLERVEILRGPQGSLYGKNTTGGAINIITAKPTEEFGGKVKVGAGNFGYQEAGISVDTGRLGDVAAFNLAYKVRENDGFYDNESATSKIEKLNKLDSEAGRFAANFLAGDMLTIDYVYDWSELNNTSSFGQLELATSVSFVPIPTAVIPDPKRLDEAALNGVDEDFAKVSGHALTLDLELNENHTLKSITGARSLEVQDATDTDGTDAAPGAGTYAHATRDIEYNQFSEELQYLGNFDAINYIIGAYYFSEDGKVSNPFHIGVAANTIMTNETDYEFDGTTTALFGHADWSVTDLVTLSAGLRFNHEEKTVETAKVNAFNPAASFSAKSTESWDNISPMIAANFHVLDNMNVYARIATGWKAGGFNAEAANQAVAETPYDDETQLSYEIGFKSQWWNDRILANMAFFFNDIKDFQVSSWDSVAQASVVGNAGEAETYGFELETALVITEGLTAFFNYGYLDSKYKEFIDPATQVDITKTALFPYSAENNYSVGLEYVQDVVFAQLRARIDYAYSDEQDFYFDTFSAATTHSDDYSLLNARVAFAEIDMGAGLMMEIGLWGKNLTDEEYRRNGFPATTNTGIGEFGGINYYGDPKTYGADITLYF